MQTTNKVVTRGNDEQQQYHQQVQVPIFEVHVSELYADIVESNELRPPVRKNLSINPCRMLDKLIQFQKKLKSYAKTKTYRNCSFQVISKMDQGIPLQVSPQAKSHVVKLQKNKKSILKTSVNLMQTLSTLVSIKSREPLSQATFMSLNFQKFPKTRKDDIMSSLRKEFRQLRKNVPKDSKLLFGDDINQRIMSISKTSKSVVKYQSHSRHNKEYYKQP